MTCPQDKTRTVRTDSGGASAGNTSDRRALKVVKEVTVVTVVKEVQVLSYPKAVTQYERTAQEQAIWKSASRSKAIV